MTHFFMMSIKMFAPLAKLHLFQNMPFTQAKTLSRRIIGQFSSLELIYTRFELVSPEEWEFLSQQYGSESTPFIAVERTQPALWQTSAMIELSSDHNILARLQSVQNAGGNGWKLRLRFRLYMAL